MVVLSYNWGGYPFPAIPGTGHRYRAGHCSRLSEPRGTVTRMQASSEQDPGVDTPAVRAASALGLEFQVSQHGPVNSLEEAAAARGIEPHDLIKTLVVRRGSGDYVFVLVPGDGTFSWPKLRALLGVSRLSMPDAETARGVTGYARGTITPLGSSTAWPVIADAGVVGRRISIGGGAHGVGITVDADALIAALGAQVADVVD